MVRPDAYGGNVQRPRKRDLCRDGAAIAVVVILRHVAAVVRGDIGHQAPRENLAGVEHCGEQKRLQDAPAAPRSPDDVDGVASLATRGPRCVADISEDLEVDIVDDNGGGVVDVFSRKPASVLPHDRARRDLYRWVDGGLETMGAVAGSSAQRVQQVRSGLPPPLAVRLEEALPFRRCDRRSPFNEPGSSKKEIDMREWKSQSHVKWYCKYHIVFSPKYRKKAMFGSLRKGVGKILRELCNQSGVELVEGHAMSDHVHLCLSIPPKYSVANTVGFLKGKSAIRIHREYLGRTRNFTGFHFWARGYCVSTVGLDEAVIRDYIRNQEEEEKHQEQQNLRGL